MLGRCRTGENVTGVLDVAFNCCARGVTTIPSHPFTIFTKSRPLMYFVCMPGALWPHNRGQGVGPVTLGFHRALYEVATVRIHGAVVGIVD